MFSLKSALNFLIKYSTLIILFIVLVYNTIIYADFNSSSSNIIILPSTILFITITIIILYISDYKKNKNFRTTNFTLLSLIVLLSIHFYFNYLHAKKEIKYTLYISPNLQLKTGGYNVKTL